MERSKAGTKEKRSPNGLNYPNQNIILINIIWYFFYKILKKYNSIQLTKNKMDFNIIKITNHPPSHGIT